MASKLLRTTVVLIALLAILAMGLSGVAHAQLPLAETFVSDDGTYSFSYPDSWTLEQGDKVTLTNNTSALTLTFVPPNPLFVDTPVDRALTLTLRSQGLTPGDVTVTDSMRAVEARQIAETMLDDGRVVLAVPFTGGGVGLVWVEGAAYGVLKATTHAIVRSFDVPDAQAAPGTCLVGTLDERTARLRVGPGQNRAPIAFLPPSVNFAPLGQGTDGDGNVWYRLDNDAAPDKAANELWVAAADVTTDGNCGALEVLEAPPVVPLGTPAATPEAGS